MKNSKIVISLVAVAAVTVASILVFNPFKKVAKSELTEAVNILPSTYSVAKGNSSADFGPLTLTSATPTTVTKSGEIINYAAKSVDTSNDGKTVTVTLKDGLKYEDGSDVKAQDYITEMKLIGTPEAKSSYSNYIIDWIEGGKDFFEKKTKEIKGLKVLAPNKYEIKLTKKITFIKSLLAFELFAPVPQAQIDKAGGASKYGADPKQILSSGEYKIKKLEKDQYLEFVKNDKSPLLEKEKDLPNSVKLRLISDVSTIINLFKNGEVNSVGKSEKSDKVLNKSKETPADFIDVTPAMSYLETSGLDKNIAKALYLALDKQYINDNIFYGTNTLNNTLVPNNYSKIVSKIPYANKNDFDLEKAKELSKDYKKEIKFLVSADAPQKTKDFNKYLLQQWTKLGLNVVIDEKPKNLMTKLKFNTQDKEREYNVTVAPWICDYANESSYYNALLGSKTSLSYSKWEGKDFDEYDKLIEQAINESNVEKSAQLYAKADKIRYDSGKLQTLSQTRELYYIQKNGYIIRGYGQMLKPTLWEKNTK